MTDHGIIHSYSHVGKVVEHALWTMNGIAAFVQPTAIHILWSGE
jgi:hypothetical protein